MPAAVCDALSLYCTPLPITGTTVKGLTSCPCGPLFLLPDLSLQLAQLLLDSLQLLLCLLSVCQPGFGLQSGLGALSMSASLSQVRRTCMHLIQVAMSHNHTACKASNFPERLLHLFHLLTCFVRVRVSGLIRPCGV